MFSSLITILSAIALSVSYIYMSNSNTHAIQGSDNETPIMKITAPYSFNFEGVDSLYIQDVDYGVSPRTEKVRVVLDPQVINEVATLLAQLPKKGDAYIDMVPGKVISVVGLKNGAQQSVFNFYGALLQAEDTAFFKGSMQGDDIAESVKKLYALVSETASVSKIGSDDEVIMPPKPLLGEKLSIPLELRYALDLSGTDSVVVQSIDYTQSGNPVTFNHFIIDSKFIDEAQKLLEKLPKNGTEMISMAPTVVTEVVGYTAGKPIVHFTFYGQRLKTENTSFYGHESDEDPIVLTEYALFDLLTRMSVLHI